MAIEEDNRETISILKRISNKVQEGTEASLNSTKKFAGTINDSVRATFADSPLLGSIVDMGESVGKDMLGVFKSKEKPASPEVQANIEAAKQRQEQKEELKQVTLELESIKNSDLQGSDFDRTDNEQIIDHLKDIKEVWEAGDNAEKEREDARRADKMLLLQEKQSKLLESIKTSKLEEDDDKFGFFEKIKQHLVLTVASLLAFIKSPITKITGFFKPLVGTLGKFLKILGPIALIIGTLIGAFTGFNKATEIFGENATIFEKVASSLAGILSGLTFGLVDIEPLAIGIKSYMDFMADTFTPFIMSAAEFFTSIGEILTASFGVLKALFTGTPSEMDAAWDTFIGAFTGIGDKFMNMATDLAEGLWTFISAIPKIIINQLGKLGSLLGSGIADFFSEKTVGEKLYNRLEDEGGLDDRLVGSDTMSKADIAKLSSEDNSLLQKYLIENEKADSKSDIIINLQNQLDKTKREEDRKSSQQASNAIIDASNTSNTTNNNYIKPNARTPDHGMKTATLQSAS